MDLSSHPDQCIKNQGSTESRWVLAQNLQKMMGDMLVDVVVEL
jgi:hypothetical protein